MMLLKRIALFLLVTIKRILRLFIIVPLLLVAVTLTYITEYVHVSAFISKIPFKTGIILRRFFYRLTLKKFGQGVVINYGTIISYSDTSIGNNVWLGVNNIFGAVDIKDNVITAQGCQFASGKYGHGTERTDIPVIYQEGSKVVLQIGPDVWFGANCTVVANVGEGCVIGSGSVVVKDIPDWSVAVGNPAKVVKSRK
jgi:virginiamycin A acetyltransferase